MEAKSGQRLGLRYVLTRRGCRDCLSRKGVLHPLLGKGKSWVNRGALEIGVAHGGHRVGLGASAICLVVVETGEGEVGHGGFL